MSFLVKKAMRSLLLCIDLSSTPQHCNDTLSLLALKDECKSENLLNTQISLLIRRINYNIFKLKSLFNIQKKLFEKVNIMMWLKAKSKEELTIEQMESYRSYIDTYFASKEDIETNVNQISMYDELSKLKIELFKNKTNYKTVYNNVSKINKIHEKAISLLNNIIFKGNQTLAVLA